MKFERSRRWKGREQARFLAELGDLLENGFSLYEGIEFSMLHSKMNHQEDIKGSLVLLKEGHSFRDFLEWLSFEQELVGLVSYGGKRSARIAPSLKIYWYIQYFSFYSPLVCFNYLQPIFFHDFLKCMMITVLVQIHLWKWPGSYPILFVFPRFCLR